MTMNNTWIKNDTNGKYLIVSAEAEYNSFEEEMISVISSPEILIPDVGFENGERCLIYEIGEFMPLEEYLKSAKFDFIKLKDILLQFKGVAEMMSRYLLQEENLMLDIGSVFVNKNQSQLVFAVFPETDDLYISKLKKLISMIFVHADTDDNEALKLSMNIMKTVSDSQKEVRIHDLIETMKSTVQKNTGDFDDSFGMKESEPEDIQWDSFHIKNTQSTDAYEYKVEDRGIDEYQNKRQSQRRNRNQRKHEKQNLKDSSEDIPKEKKEETAAPKEKTESKNIKKENTNVAEEERTNDISGEQPHSRSFVRFLFTELIMFCLVMAVFFFKGVDTIRQFLPIYLVLAGCTALYYFVEGISGKLHRKADFV